MVLCPPASPEVPSDTSIATSRLTSGIGAMISVDVVSVMRCGGDANYGQWNCKLDCKETRNRYCLLFGLAQVFGLSLTVVQVIRRTLPLTLSRTRENLAEPSRDRTAPKGNHWQFSRYLRVFCAEIGMSSP